MGGLISAQRLHAYRGVGVSHRGAESAYQGARRDAGGAGEGLEEEEEEERGEGFEEEEAEDEHAGQSNTPLP
jgi:hypothetical protein